MSLAGRLFTQRFTLLGIAVTQATIGLAFVIVGAIVTVDLEQLLDDFPRITIYLHILVHVCLTCFSCFGISAIIKRRRKSVSLFISFMLAQCLMEMVSGILSLVLLFLPPKPELVDRCASAEVSSFSKGFCDPSVALKAVAVVLFIVVWLLEISAIVLLNMYTSTLSQAEEDNAWKKFSDGSSINGNGW